MNTKHFLCIILDVSLHRSKSIHLLQGSKSQLNWANLAKLMNKAILLKQADTQIKGDVSIFC